MKQHFLSVLAGVALTLGAGDVQAQPKVPLDQMPPEMVMEMGRQLAFVCQACHGLGNKGKPSSPFVPRIAGQHADYTVKQIQAYRSGARQGGMAAHMRIVADLFSDDQYGAVAIYLESLDD